MPNRLERFNAALSKLPLIAILRGVTPSEAEGIAETLYECGFRLIEVPLNSPDPFTSIKLMRRCLPSDALVGAGTVLDEADIAKLLTIDADLVVMPHSDTRIIGIASQKGLICVPGIISPTEAFAALKAGAQGLKLFPAELVSPATLKAMRAVLPKHVPIFPVGGISPDVLTDYLEAGANGFGLGSAVYKPGISAIDVKERAMEFVRQWHLVTGTTPI